MGYYGVLSGLLVTVVLGRVVVGGYLDGVERKINADWREKHGHLPVPLAVSPKDWDLIALSTKGGHEGGVL